MKFPVFQFVPIASSPFTGCSWRCSLVPSSLLVLIKYLYTLIKSLLKHLFWRLGSFSSLRHPFMTGAPTPHHACSFLLICSMSVFLLNWGAQDWTVLQIFCQCWVEAFPSTWWQCFSWCSPESCRTSLLFWVHYWLSLNLMFARTPKSFSERKVKG